MEFPIEITFRNLEPTSAMEAAVRKRATGLGRYCPRILDCRVVVEAPHRNLRKGKLYHVGVDINLPGRKLVVHRDPKEHKSHRDFYVAIRNAFDAARRELMDQTRRRRMQVKSHAGGHHGRVIRLSPGGFGYLETPDGREIYFHRNCVLSGFEHLTVGATVRFSEEMGEQGPQATTLVQAGADSGLGVVPRP